MDFREYYANDLRTFWKMENWAIGFFTAGIAAATYTIWRLPTDAMPKVYAIELFVLHVAPGIVGLFGLIFVVEVNRRIRVSRARLEWCLARAEEVVRTPPPELRVRPQGGLGDLIAILPWLFGLLCSASLGLNKWYEWLATFVLLVAGIAALIYAKKTAPSAEPPRIPENHS